MLPRQRTDPFESDVANVEAAIELVRSGLARRIRLVGLIAAVDLAPIGLARAQAVDVGFTIDRHGDSYTLTIGPRHTRP